MSFYRESPSRSYKRSPPRGLADRDLIEEEIHLKNAFRSESENRRLLDQIALLQIKLRKTDELEAKCDGLLKQNSLLAQQNDHLSRQLADRRYEIERFKSNTLQLQERDTIKSTQLTEINRSLELEIDLLKKERMESNKLYEGHIQKLQFMLEDKIKELDMLSVRFNEFINEKQINEIKFQEQKNRLKNLMVRTSHDMEREIEYTREKQSTEKYVEIQTLKKNYTSQILLLEDQIGKLKSANSYKNSEFEAQLAENKNIRQKYDQELRNLELENGGLRQKIIKLEELNRSEVVNIQVKYNDIQRKGADRLVHGHEQQIQIMLNQIDRLSWLLRDKNQEIQNLIREKKEHRILEEERQLAFRAEIDTLKNKLDLQQDKYTQENHQLTNKINSLSDKLLRESQNYHQRVNSFRETINNLENQVKSKQNQIDRTKAENQIKARELQRTIEELHNSLDRTRRELSDTQRDRVNENKAHQEYRVAAENEKSHLNKKIRELQVKNEELANKLAQLSESSGDNERLLRLEIESLTKTVCILEKKLSQEQQRHSKEMHSLSTNLKLKIEALIATQKNALTEVEVSRAEELEALQRRLDKASREKQEAEIKLVDYVKMYENLEKYFAKPHEGSIFTERGESNVYEVLSKVTKSTIHIF